MLQTITNVTAVMNNPELWKAIVSRDASRDGSFVFAVRSTGIYCRPSCPARRPRRAQVRFFQVPEAAEQAGFRACRRCHPRRVQADDPQVELVRRICHAIDEHDEEPVTLNALSTETGVSAHHLQRTFKSVMGITPRQYAECRRLRIESWSLREVIGATGHDACDLRSRRPRDADHLHDWCLSARAHAGGGN